VIDGAGAPSHLEKAVVVGRVVRGVLVALGVLGALVLAASAETVSAASVPSSGAISAGSNFTCGIRTDGTLVCWGDPTLGWTIPLGTFSQVSSGFSHACGIRIDGSLACWGDNASGQTNAPPGTFSQVSSGNGFTCAVKTDQTLVCWGDPSLGWTIPPGTFSQVSSGGFGACGVRTDGTLACWGLNLYDLVSNTPGGTFSQVSAGYLHTCAVQSGGTVVCWGSNSFGQVSPLPTGIFSQVSSGGSHTCGIQVDGTVACWGYNFFGQAPPLVAGTFSQVSSGGLFTCGVQTDGTPVCWGDPTGGETTLPAGGLGPPADTTPPVITLPANITAEATGPSGAVVTYAVSAVDPDDAATVSCMPASGSTFPLGLTTVSCTATDTHGNTASGTFTVTVADTTPPVLTINVTSPVEATGPNGAVVTFTASATDAVSGSPATICTPPSGSTFPVGSTTITCTATDGAGNLGTATATVVVEDKTAPTLSLPANVTAEATGPSGAVVTYAVSATDPDDAATVACTPISGTTFPIGVTTVTCTATDTNANSASGTFTVTVTDTTPPVLTINVTSPMEATGPSGAAVTYTATAVDIVSGSLTPNCLPASGSTFPLGTTTITCSATDGAGNTGTATATVLVEDKTAPTLSLPANITAVATSAGGAVVTYVVSATDPDNATSALTVSCSPPSGSTFPAGVTTVTCTATDAAGNTGTGSFQIAVVDFSMGPIAAVTVPVGGTASTSVTVNSVSGFNSAVALGASGAPAGVSVTLNPSSVTPSSGGSASSTLTLQLSPMVTPTTFTLTVTGTFAGVSHSSAASITVAVSSSALSDVVGQMLVLGCINNSGVDDALAAKVTAEQGAVAGGNTKTAINILSAFIDQVGAQSGKHITPDCATVLSTDARSLIDGLAVSATPNPITGSVRTASGTGVPGAVLTLKDSAGTTAATATTDITGFYFFATTGVLTSGATYTVTFTVPIGFTATSAAGQTFTWSGGAEVSLADFTTT